jgi:hypothetical protein
MSQRELVMPNGILRLQGVRMDFNTQWMEVGEAIGHERRLKANALQIVMEQSGSVLNRCLRDQTGVL